MGVDGIEQKNLIEDIKYIVESIQKSNRNVLVLGDDYLSTFHITTIILENLQGHYRRVIGSNNTILPDELENNEETFNDLIFKLGGNRVTLSIISTYTIPQFEEFISKIKDDGNKSTYDTIIFSSLSYALREDHYRVLLKEIEPVVVEITNTLNDSIITYEINIVDNYSSKEIDKPEVATIRVSKVDVIEALDKLTKLDINKQ